MTTILLTHSIVSSTNQENGKHSPSPATVMTISLYLLRIGNMPTTIMILTMKIMMMIMIMVVLVVSKPNLPGTGNIPTIIMQHVDRGVNPGSSVVLTEHNFLSLVITILRRYWICHARTSKICYYCNTNFFLRRLLQMSTESTHDAREQAALQGPKALEFVKTLHRLYCLLRQVFQTILLHQRFLLKIVTRRNNKKIIYVLIGISMTTTMIQTLARYHYFHQ